MDWLEERRIDWCLNIELVIAKIKKSPFDAIKTTDAFAGRPWIRSPNRLVYQKGPHRRRKTAGPLMSR
jgi:hypothetical protein